ncbi:fimbria/pilus periplasmic chaperone [Escherichia coli]|nr:fimbria/pilus periplasmic chaperone [Escherichia coli]
MRIKTVISFVLILFCCMNSYCYAGIQLDRTRIIYPASEKEVTVSLVNKSTAPRLLQTWIDSGDYTVSPEKASGPFVVSPPIFRVDAGKGQTLRIFYTGTELPKDRESVFWLNILEVKPKPPVADNGTDNYMHVSVRTRMKIFFRPVGLTGTPEESVSRLLWRVIHNDAGYGLECKNSSAYNVSFSHVLFSVDKSKNIETDNGICPARGERIFALHGTPGNSNGKVHFTYIDDFGGFKDEAQSVIGN